jgi:hypothetical protein
MARGFGQRMQPMPPVQGSVPREAVRSRAPRTPLAEREPLPRDEHGRPISWTEHDARSRGGPVDVQSIGGGRKDKGGRGLVFFVVLRFGARGLDDVFLYRIADAFG